MDKIELPEAAIASLDSIAAGLIGARSDRSRRPRGAATGGRIHSAGARLAMGAYAWSHCRSRGSVSRHRSRLSATRFARRSRADSRRSMQRRRPACQLANDDTNDRTPTRGSGERLVR